MGEKRHIYYFDWLRLFACLFVIFMHTAATPIRGEIGKSWWLCNLGVSLSFTAVPLFFMMSGYLILSDPKTADVSVLFRKRLPKLIVPLTFWSVVAALYKNIITAESISVKNIIADTFRAFNGSTEVHLWYIYTLAALYIISPILYRALNSEDEKLKKMIFIFIISIELFSVLRQVLPYEIAQYMKVDILDKLDFLSGDLCVFILGYYVGHMKCVPLWTVIAGGIVSYSAIVGYTYYFTVTGGEYSQKAQNQHGGLEIILAVAIFLLFKAIAQKPSKFHKYFPVVQLSMGIYFMHIFVIYILGLSGFPNDSFKSSVLRTVITFAVSYISIKIAASIKPICYIVTGMKYETACKTCNFVFTYNNIKALFSKEKVLK